MSNRKEVINISSSSDKNFENTPKIPDVPNTPGPSDVPSRKRSNPWIQQYKGYWKKGKSQRIVVMVISSSKESEEEESEDEDTKEELEEEEEEPEEEPEEEEEEPEEEPEEEEEEPEEEPMEDADNQRELEDAIWGQDPKPTTSGDSICSRVGSEPVVASPLPRIHHGALFEANCTWND